MNTPPNRKPAGYVSYLMVLTLGLTVLLMMMSTYRTATRSQQVQAEVTLRGDYDTKEEAVLRAIVPLTANSAMKAMMGGSDESSTTRQPLLWQKIFRQAIVDGNAETSVNNATLKKFGLADAVIGNPGDAETYSAQTFRAYDSTSSYAMPGLDQDFGINFPPPLETSSSRVRANDRDYPIITTKKYYGSLSASRVGASVSEYKQFNLIPYPNIRFGYTTPGEPFVAKRNWWAFRMNLADHHQAETGVQRRERDFVLSIYEVPSQLAISAEASAVLGEYEDGSQWKNTNIAGGVFASQARVGAGMNLERISGRNGLEISNDAQIGDQPLLATGDPTGVVLDENGMAVGTDPFAPGVRERYEITNGNFMPVSLSSESGRTAFIPINRGADFFDRYCVSDESQTLSDTTWSDYTIGARQCAMSLDIADAVSTDDPTPTTLKFRYQKNGSTQTMTIDLTPGSGTGLPSGYVQCCGEGQSYFFPYPVDVAYGYNGHYYYQYGVSGSITFNNARFGDPLYGTFKYGYFRPSYPWEVTLLHGTKTCITLYPERFAKFLALIGADTCAVNHSIAVNVDYPGSAVLQRPSIPCTELDYGVVLQECADLTSFTKGFSVVTNLRLYIADDFNTTATTPPAGSGLPSPFYPPCSLFAPEKRYGAENDPYNLKISGQLGSLAGAGDHPQASVHLLDVKAASDNEVAHDNLEVNLAPIVHPAALPPICMMNWLIVLEERRREFYEGNAVDH
ncbi:hypothetical protein [Haloferula sargassicola]|uniref:Uncharacterized protein n=1 Tax=Haloferula sargassicola TaxID=490096 RepID=A0ABP9UNK1_9BACT